MEVLGLKEEEEVVVVVKSGLGPVESKPNSEVIQCTVRHPIQTRYDPDLIWQSSMENLRACPYP